ncbi:MAG: redoxin domain-containing protein [Pyrinomonadaceae bacterium]
MKLKILLLIIFLAMAIAANAQGIAIGTAAENFALPDLDGKVQMLNQLKGRNGTVVIFLSAQCPVVKAYKDRINQIAAESQAKGINLVGINSNANESLASLRSNASAFGYRFPVLIDKNNKLADKLDARTAPEVFFIDRENVLLYHGAIDSDYTGRSIAEKYLGAALDASLAGRPITKTSAPPFGCTIRRVAR